MVIEVLSPSNRSWDMIDKLKLYKDYDVKEYWIVDPDKKCTLVYIFDDKEQMLESYGFDEVVSLSIFEGLEIRMDELLE